ncbi:MAG: sarcosine oxidase subunit alpha, partial [Geminicoccaceae bacterium]|nr:sarcosine oxidase subunit alpha [Geminicoccaceae bacterium]
DLSQTEWPELEVYFTSVTEQWATMALNGPRARDVLQPLVAGDISADAFEHMAWMEATIAGVKGRIFRISFTGELSFEINVPAGYGQHVWEAIVERGRAHDLCVYGTETMHVLRAEKGYIIVGQETDGTATPHDLGMGWIVAGKKADFIGKRGLQRPDLMLPDRKQLVGLLTADPQVVLDEGAQVTASRQITIPMPMIGHVTSSYMSANCGRSIALAMVRGGHGLHGETLYVPRLDGGVTEVEVTKPLFFDAEGARIHG